MLTQESRGEVKLPQVTNWEWERGESPQENNKVIARGREDRNQENKTMDDLCGHSGKGRIIQQLEAFWIPSEATHKLYEESL